MKLVKEAISFERKKDPKETLIGDKYTEENLKAYWEAIDEDIKTLDEEYQKQKKLLSSAREVIRAAAFREHHDMDKAFLDAAFFNYGDKNREEGVNAIKDYLKKKFGIKIHVS